MGVKLLCTGDVHLGRRPSRLPDHLDATDLGPAAAWAALITQAVERKVDAVVLTGDVVDQDNRFYEAYGPLARGVRTLVQADIGVYAVAGNHDFDVFARLADEIPDFHLLGRGGVWEETRLNRDGKPVLRLVGWSFPSSHVSTSPLAGASLPTYDKPTVALLHCDYDAANSRYAPVTRAELAGLPVDAWLLGHIHKPQIISKSKPLILYPGSPQGLHVNETGPHGPWLVEIEPGQAPTVIQLPLAALRWEHLDVALDDLSELEAFNQTITRALKALHERIGDNLGPAQAVGCRLRLTGRTVIYRELHELIADMLDSFTRSLQFDSGNVDYFIDPKVENDARPDIALVERSQVHDPPGLLARRLVVLQDRAPADEYDELIAAARSSIADSKIRRDFEGVTDRTLGADDAELVATLLAVGTKALDAMLAQKETRP